MLRLVEACVRKIDREPALIAVARNNVTRWSNDWLRLEWERLLDLPWAELRGLLLEDSDRGCMHRQNAPLGGILTHRERLDLLNARVT